ncbi:unnamed protein product, partial [Dicrocoelium dendriticum]
MNSGVCSFNEFHLLNLDQRILKAINELRWEKPTDIQQAIIPLIFEGKSIVVQAKTGSGKTAAYAIPIIHELLQEKQLNVQLFLFSPLRKSFVARRLKTSVQFASTPQILYISPTCRSIQMWT